MTRRPVSESGEAPAGTCMPLCRFYLLSFIYREYFDQKRLRGGIKQKQRTSDNGAHRHIGRAWNGFQEISGPLPLNKPTSNIKYHESSENRRNAKPLIIRTAKDSAKRYMPHCYAN